MPPTWRAIMDCAASKCGSAVPGQGASQPSVRWPQLALKYARSKIRHPFRIMGAGRQSVAEYDAASSQLPVPSSRFSVENGTALTENWEPLTGNLIFCPGRRVK